jgi:hypothetical protein
MDRINNPVPNEERIDKERADKKEQLRFSYRPEQVAVGKNPLVFNGRTMQSHA